MPALQLFERTEHRLMLDRRGYDVSAPVGQAEQREVVAFGRAAREDHVSAAGRDDARDLVAGVLVGPHTPGFVADQGLALELAEIGVILLMFGVGLHFSLKDLLSVRAIAVPGAVVQIVFATLLGWGLAWMLGWSHGAGIVFGLALSVASTVVLLRALQERRMLETLDLGKPMTPFLSFGDRVRIEMLDGAGRSIFGAIDQRVVKAA